MDIADGYGISNKQVSFIARLARINPADYLAAVTPTLITYRRLCRANLPTPGLAGLTPKRWASERHGMIRRAS